MKRHDLPLAGACIVETTPVRDERGWFARTFCSRTFREWGLIDTFVQTNSSQSLRRGTIRGLHYQQPPAAEAKLFRCTRGRVQDMIVDLRRGSRTFLRWHSEVFSGDDPRALYVPPGCAHGYQALEDGSEVTYQVSAYYSPELEGRVRYNDPRIGIVWLVPDAIVSPKDASTPDVPADFKGVEL